MDQVLDRREYPAAGPKKPGRPPLGGWRAWGAAAAAVGLTWLLVRSWSSVKALVSGAISQAMSTSPGWLVLAFALAAASMLAFGLLRRRTLRAAGGDIAVPEAVAVSYAAGAIHLTAPAGGVLSTGYAFRRLQQRGVPPAAITWSLAISGVLSTVTLVLLGAVGFVLGAASSAWTALLPALAITGVIGTLLALAVRRPDRLAGGAHRLLRIGNQVLRRPPDSGRLAVQTTVADLRSVHPTGLDWVAAASAAAANWLLDLLCLWACTQALGIHISPWLLLPSYCLAMAGASVSPVPGGIGIVDGILVLAVTSTSSAATGVAVGAVILYRVISLGSLLVGGWSAVGVRSIRTRTTRTSVGAPA